MTAEWIGLVEIAILGVTLLTTVGLSLFIALQARRHFRLQHAKEFIARFNAAEMVKVRDAVDHWLSLGRDPGELIEAEQTGQAETACDAHAVAVRTFINFFQELGVAWKHGTVHREYTWDLFAGLIAKYWAALLHYCRAQRIAKDRPTLYCDFESLARQMAEMDRHHSSLRKKSAQSTEAYLFGYGSLMSPESIARTLGRPVELNALKTVWLNGYERGWTVYDTLLFGDQGEGKPAAFLNIRPHAGRRCNGIALPVRIADLNGFDQRERNYRRVDVSALISPPLERPVFTYVGKEPWTRLPPDTVVASKYIALVESALTHWSPAFRESYHASTAPCPHPREEGSYTFAPQLAKDEE